MRHCTSHSEPLSECVPGERFVIDKLTNDDSMKRRLLDLGFVKGAEIEVIKRSPLGDPVAYLVSGTTIALRHSESSKIFGKVVREGLK